MKNNPFRLLTKFEILLLCLSLSDILLSFFLVGSRDWLNLAVSLVGALMLIFVSKGEVFGQVVAIAFALLYAAVSWGFTYYGEVIICVSMTLPLAVLSLISWLRHPYEKGKTEVKIARLTKKQVLLMFTLAAAVTTGFYFVLKAFHTANLAVSTVSITTSFLASWLLLFRSPFYGLAYAANDVVLVTMWILAALENIAYLPMAVCFCVFLFNDLYGFFNWSRLLKRQTKKPEESTLSSDS